MKILLGSASPRRRELLQQLGYDFEVVKIDCEESFPDDLECKFVAEFIAEKKANHHQNLQKNEVLITADTVVSCENKILGKPENEVEAVQMLQNLSGKMHEVHTAVVFKTENFTKKITDTAEVYFENLTEEEIKFYVENYKPLDKAGSYGIQDWLGMAKIAKINGSFYTVMGLPTHLVYRELCNLTKEKINTSTCSV